MAGRGAHQNQGGAQTKSFHETNEFHENELSTCQNEPWTMNIKDIKDNKIK